MSPRPPTETLGSALKRARRERELSLRDVERRTGIKSGHLSQIETGTIARPDMAILWDLAEVYAVDFDRLLALAGLAPGGESSGRARQRMTVALRALEGLSPEEQAATLAFMADLRARRDRG
jgi:transcriptional regulator with XRE-family HTH domain